MWTYVVRSTFHFVSYFTKVTKLCQHALMHDKYLFSTESHSAFSPNLIHGQITQISIDHMSSPENKKCSPWKVFGINHPQTLRLLSRRGPRGLDMRLSQHYIGPKMTFCHFSTFCRKKFPGLTNKFLHIFVQLWRL